MIREGVRMRTLSVKPLLGHFDFPRRALVILCLRRGHIFRNALLAFGGGWCHDC